MQCRKDLIKRIEELEWLLTGFEDYVRATALELREFEKRELCVCAALCLSRSLIKKRPMSPLVTLGRHGDQVATKSKFGDCMWSPLAKVRSLWRPNGDHTWCSRSPFATCRSPWRPCKWRPLSPSCKWGRHLRANSDQVATLTKRPLVKVFQHLQWNKNHK